jgi:hypothetical protein
MFCARYVVSYIRVVWISTSSIWCLHCDLFTIVCYYAHACNYFLCAHKIKLEWYLDIKIHSRYGEAIFQKLLVARPHPPILKFCLRPCFPGTTTEGHPEGFHPELRLTRTILVLPPYSLRTLLQTDDHQTRMHTSLDPLRALPRIFTASRLDLRMRETGTSIANSVLFKHNTMIPPQHHGNRGNAGTKANPRWIGDATSHGNMVLEICARGNNKLYYSYLCVHK